MGRWVGMSQSLLLRSLQLSSGRRQRTRWCQYNGERTECSGSFVKGTHGSCGASEKGARRKRHLNWELKTECSCQGTIGGENLSRGNRAVKRMGHQRCREGGKNKQISAISEAEARSQRVSSHRRGGMLSEGLEVTWHVDFGCPWRVTEEERVESDWGVSDREGTPEMYIWGMALVTLWEVAVGATLASGKWEFGCCSNSEGISQHWV